jgi:hypothetical protein
MLYRLAKVDTRDMGSTFNAGATLNVLLMLVLMLESIKLSIKSGDIDSEPAYGFYNQL